MRWSAIGHAGVLAGAGVAAALVLAGSPSGAGVLADRLPPVGGGVGILIGGLAVLAAAEVLALLLVRALGRAGSPGPPQLVLAAQGVGRVLAGPVPAAQLVADWLLLGASPARPVVALLVALLVGTVAGAR